MKFNRNYIFVITILFVFVAFFQNCTRTKFTSDPEIESLSSNENAAQTERVVVVPGSSNCASQSVSWRASGSDCSALAADMNNGANGVSIIDSVGGLRGTANISCSNGKITVDTTPAATCASSGGGGDPTPTVYKERAKFLKGLYKKSVDTQAVLATGYHSSAINNIAYCMQSLGATYCDSPANYVPFSSPNPNVLFFYYSQAAYYGLNLGVGQYLNHQEIFLSIKLAGVSPGVYEVRISEISYVNSFGWGGSIYPDEIIMSSGIASLEE